MLHSVASRDAERNTSLNSVSQKENSGVNPLHTDSSRPVLRHLVATLTYRAAKVLRDAPPGFGGTAFGSSTRKPVLIVAHLADLMGWAVRMARGEYSWKAEGGDDWNTEVKRFFNGLATLDELLASDASLRGEVEKPVEKLIQGPLADALTHVGQIAYVRRLGGAPVRGENYFKAEIAAGRVGPDQAPPVREFD